MFKRIVFISMCLFSPEVSFPQENSVDSIQQLIQTYQTGKDKFGEARSLFELGSRILFTARTTDAFYCLNRAADLYQTLGDSVQYAWCLYKISYLYNLTGDYSKSFKYALHANTIAETYANKSLNGFTKNLLGRLYYLLSDEETAMRLYNEALREGTNGNNAKLIAEATSYIAIVWRNRDSLDHSFRLQREALRLREGINENEDCASSYLNIGILYSYKKQNDSAVFWLRKAESIWKTKQDYFNLAECYNYFGKAYLKLNKAEMARDYFNKSLELALKTKAKKMIRYNYYDLAMLNYGEGDTKKAMEQILLYTLYKDSVIRDQGLLEITNLETKNVKQKNENEIKLLNKENELKESELSRGRVLTASIAIGLLLVALLSGFIYRSLRVTVQQKKIIEKKNKELTDSINYAKRIQDAILPDLQSVMNYFPDSFIFFKPKDVVSGDFYFFYDRSVANAAHNEVGVAIIAAVDCTGHGVPGAFMSLVGYERLSDAVQQSSDPGEILSLLNRGMKRSMHQSGDIESTNDGMDIALCTVDRASRVVTYAGANRPLWIIRSGKDAVEEIKGSKKEIGGMTDEAQVYESTKIQLEAGDTFYIFSDGYADTFSAKGSKKITTKRFREMLIGIQNCSMDEQKKHVELFIENWKSGIEQVDDILVIGVRL